MIENYNLKDKFDKEKRNEKLAQKLLCGEIGTNELSEIQIDEMTEYFTKDINNINNELFRIKQHILCMQ